MNFQHSANTTHRPQTTSSHFNEDARCDNEVNLILEKNYNQQLFEQSIYSEEQQKQQQQQQPPPQPPPPPPPPQQQQQLQTQTSAVVSQTDQYYFMPIREQSSTMALHTNNNSTTVDNTSIMSVVHDKPTKHDLFDYSATTKSNTSSFASTATTKGNNYLQDSELAGLFASSIVTISRSNTSMDKNDITDNPNTLDDIFFQQVSELVCASQQNPLGPPPGFENFRFDTTSSSSDSLTTVSSISTAAAAAGQSKVSTSDTTNYSQLLPSTNVESTQEAGLINGGNVCSSSSSHSSFASDDQTIFFPMGPHPYSSSSQIFPINTPLSGATNSMNSNAKPFLPNSLSTNAKHFASPDKSDGTSPKLTTHFDTDTMLKDRDATPNQIFHSPDSFFTNGQADFATTKPSSNRTSSTSASTNRQSSSSASSSTSSSIDDALIQLSQQQQQSQVPAANKLFSDDSISIFNFPAPKSATNIDKQQRAVHDNINFLASMAAASTPVTPESPWQQPATHSSTNTQSKTQSMRQQPQPSVVPQSPSKTASSNMQELMENLNELCYRGFDELNALIQEQRWVQNYLNINSSSLPSSNVPLVNLNGANCCSSRILIVPEYFIFKCRKVEVTASHVYNLLSAGRPELRLRDLMFVFKSWRETIANAEHVHQEEDMKLRLNTEHFPSYYMNETILQAVFERAYLVIRQLVSMTQQARAAFQYATLNVFQMSSRQPSQSSSNLSQSSNSIGLAQLQGMQQPKSSSVHRLGGSMRTTP